MGACTRGEEACLADLEPVQNPTSFFQFGSILILPVDPNKTHHSSLLLSLLVLIIVLLLQVSLIFLWISFFFSFFLVIVLG